MRKGIALEQFTRVLRAYTQAVMGIAIVHPTSFVFFSLAAIGANDVFQAGQAVGTASNQVILGCLVVVLIFVVIYGERGRIKRELRAEQRHEEIMLKMDSERAAMNTERRDRIAMVLEVVKDNTKAMTATAEAVNNFQHVLRTMARRIKV